jgi:hypothetical protein
MRGKLMMRSKSNESAPIIERSRALTVLCVLLPGQQIFKIVRGLNDTGVIGILPNCKNPRCMDSLDVWF